MSPKGKMPPPSLAVMIGKEKGGAPPASDQPEELSESSFMCPACGVKIDTKAADSGNGMDLQPDAGGDEPQGDYGT